MKKIFKKIMFKFGYIQIVFDKNIITKGDYPLVMIGGEIRNCKLESFITTTISMDAENLVLQIRSI